MFNYGEAQKKGMTVDYGEKSGALELTMGWCTGVEHPGENALQRKRKSNCGNDPLACGSLRRQQQLTYERCDLGVESSGKLCLEWARKNVSGIRNDTMGHSQHVRCKVCGWVTHSKGENFCYKHLKECCSKAQQGMEDSSEVANPKSLEEYIFEALPCFAAQSNLSTEGFLECVKNLFQEFPPDIHPSEAASILPSPREFHISER